MTRRRTHCGQAARKYHRGLCRGSTQTEQALNLISRSWTVRRLTSVPGVFAGAVWTVGHALCGNVRKRRSLKQLLKAVAEIGSTAMPPEPPPELEMAGV